MENTLRENLEHEVDRLQRILASIEPTDKEYSAIKGYLCDYMTLLQEDDKTRFSYEQLASEAEEKEKDRDLERDKEVSVSDEKEKDRELERERLDTETSNQTRQETLETEKASIEAEQQKRRLKHEKIITAIQMTGFLASILITAISNRNIQEAAHAFESAGFDYTSGERKLPLLKFPSIPHF